MSTLSSVLVGGMVLVLLTMSCVQFLMLMRNEAANLNDLVRIRKTWMEPSCSISGFKLSNTTALLNVSVTGGSVSIRDLRSSDIFVGCVNSNGTSRIYLMSYGADWRITRVSLMDGVEILNPSNPELISGWLDPGEVASIEIRIPETCDSARPVVLIFVSLSGEVEVVTAHG